jgi:hypothetical protein
MWLGWKRIDSGWMMMMMMEAKKKRIEAEWRIN